MVCWAGGRREEVGPCLLDSQPRDAQLWSGPDVANTQLNSTQLNSKTPAATIADTIRSLQEFKRNVRLNYYLLPCGTHSLCRDQNWSKTKIKARPALGWGEQKHLWRNVRAASREDHSRVVRVMSNLMEAIKAGWIISNSGGKNGWEMKLIFRRIILANHSQRVPAERAWTKWGNVWTAWLRYH